MNLIEKNPLFWAFMLPASADFALTLAGQSKDYWLNNKLVNEASPAYIALVLSPWIYILGSIVWFLFWYFVFKKLKEPVNLCLMFLFITGNSWGSGSWIWKLLKDNKVYQLDNRVSITGVWSLIVFYFIIVAIAASHCLNLYIKKFKK